MVTRVESPPEQLQMSAPAAPAENKDAAKTNVNTNTSATQKTPLSSQTQATGEDLKEGSPAPSDKKAEPSPVASTERTPNTTELQSASQPTDEVTGQSSQAPARLTDSSPVQDVVPQLTDVGAESSRSSKEGEEERRDDRPETRSEVKSAQTGLSAQQELSGSGTELLENDTICSESPNQTKKSQQEEEEEEEEGHTLASLSEKEELSSIKREETSQEETRPKQQTEAVEQEAESGASVTQSEAQESDPPVTETTKDPEHTPEVCPSTVVEEEESADESSADEGECFTDALEDETVASALPNGLKPEFTLHLLDTESPKPGSCVMEHVSVSCGQDLEELLLEASLEMGKDAP